MSAQIIHIAPGGDYDRYEELTLQKDQLQKEAEEYRLQYLYLFGERMTAAFSMQIECIALKKEITLYVQARNSGNPITQAEVEAYLKIHMAAYREQLRQMIDEQRSIQPVGTLSPSEEQEIKQIYRRLAKLLHPDISPLTQEFPELEELFRRVIVAYRCDDLKELRKLEVLVRRAMESHGGEPFHIVIPDMAERILELEKEIHDILTHEPYTYKALLQDRDAIRRRQQELEEEIDHYTRYKAQLDRKSVV